MKLFSGKPMFSVICLIAIGVVGFSAFQLYSAGMSKIPLDLDKVPPAERDMEILRVGMIAELDAVNLYEQMAVMATNKHIKKMLLYIAREEKTHIGEFQALLLTLDKEMKEELKAGEEEARELQNESEEHHEAAE